MLRLQRIQQNLVEVIVLRGDLTGGPESKKLYLEVSEGLEDKIRLFLLDLQQVHRLNTAGIGEMITAYVSVKRRNGRLVLCSLSEHHERSLRHTRLIPDVFEVFADRETALRALSPPQQQALN